MKKNLLSSIFVFGLILIGLFLLAGSQLETKVAAAADYESHGPQTHETMTADQARWDALGEFYASHAGPRSAEAITADQARWDALGEFYNSQAGARSAEAITANS